MTLKETTLPFLAQDCRQAFGPHRGGDTLYQQTEARFQALLAQADDRGSPAIRDHLARKLLPPPGLLPNPPGPGGMDQAAALDLVRQETRQAAQEKEGRNGLPGPAPLPHLVPPRGQETHGQALPPRRVGDPVGPAATGRRSISTSTPASTKPSPRPWAPELCPLYCENDDIAFAGLAPKITFHRTGTLASGAPCCDFHFLKE